MLARLHLDGLGVPACEEKAVAILQRGAQRGSAASAWALGRLHWERWGDLPKGTRIQLAGGEYVEAKLALEGRLRAQLDALADHRPLAYEARLSALYAIDPMSALSEARTVRQGATSIEERLRRDLRASASAPQL